MEGKGKDSTELELCSHSEPSVPPELESLELYQQDTRLCERFPKLYPAWLGAYPGVDIVAEIRKAHAWEVSNPKKRKKDRPRFLSNWLSRAQDKARPSSAGQKGDWRTT